MTAQHAAAPPWRADLAEVARSLRLAAVALYGRLRAILTPALDAHGQESRPGDPPLCDGEVRAGATTTPVPGAAPGQAQDPAQVPTGQDAAPEPVPAGDDGAATRPLRAIPPGVQGQRPYQDWPQPPLGCLVIATPDGAVEYRRPDAIITIRATPGGGTSTDVWTPRRRQQAARTGAWLDLPVVPRWYRAWLAAHPEAEVAA